MGIGCFWSRLVLLLGLFIQIMSSSSLPSSPAAQQKRPTKIAIVGGGNVGTTLADSIVNAPPNANHQFDVCIAARDPNKTRTKLIEWEMEHLQVADSMAAAIVAANVIILATSSAHSDEAIAHVAQSLGYENLKGKIIIDATNPLSSFEDGLQVRWGMTKSGAEVLQSHLPSDCRVYKAFNTVGVELMARPRSTMNVDMLYAGPDEEIANVIAAVGFMPRYVGPLRYARNLEAMAELWIHCAIPPLPAANWGRDWTFGVAGNPTTSSSSSAAETKEE
jgi:8-hydroxy-5-deazaflavin:NADPH oxidoreductase